jgi:hypothetical protein
VFLKKKKKLCFSSQVFHFGHKDAESDPESEFVANLPVQLD